MFSLDTITDDTFQTQTISLEDGTTFDIVLYFVPLQYSWFILSLKYEEFEIKNHRICNSPNMLHQFKNKIPFGIACFSDGGREPMLAEDFLSGSSKLFLLTEAEADEYGEYLSDG